MAFLLDTNVVSELRKATPHPNVAAWHSRSRSAASYISALVVGEIRSGIERMRPRDPRQAENLERWLTRMVTSYQDRILAVSLDVAQEWGRLNAADPIPVVDGLMAATALVHRLTLVTRNVNDVGRTGVVVVNPFDME